MSNKNKLVLVSGGGRGLGLAIIQNLLNQHYAVASFSRNTTPEVEKLQKQYPEQFLWSNLDATDFTAVNHYMESLIGKYHSIYALVNNAAIAADGVITLMPPAKISQVLQVNLEAVFHLTQLCVNHMLLQNNSVILNISSIIATRGYAGLSVYAASKAGLDGMTRSLARELGARNIRVNSIAPGYLETEMSKSLNASEREKIIRRTPLGRLGTVSDIVGVVAFLLSDDARFITGQTLVVDGGINC